MILKHHGAAVLVFSFACGSALAQSQADIASKINSALPDNGRGQITASGLRGVMNSLNGARGQPNGIAELGPDGRLLASQGQTTFTDGNFPGSVTATNGLFGKVKSGPATPGVDTTLSTRFGAGVREYKNPNVIAFSPGNTFSICPALSCLAGNGDGSPSNDHHRTTMLVSGTTQDDAHSQENTLSVITTIDKGYATQWAANTTYAANANVRNGSEIYRAAASCTSGNSGPGGLALSGIVDGSCRWGWINAAAINAKVGAYVETKVMPGAGPAWGAAFNYHFENDPTIPGNFWPGVEFDYANDSGKDCVIGVADCTSMRIGIAGNGQITHGVQITGDGFVRDGQQRKSMIWGIRLNGDHAVSGAGIEVDLQSEVGIGFGTSGIGLTSFSQAAIKDVSTSPVGLEIGGTHTNAITLGGTITGAQIVGNNFTVFPDGGTKVKNLLITEDSVRQLAISYNPLVDRTDIQSTNQGSFNTEIALNPLGGNVFVGGLIRETSTPPASASAACIAGTRTWDASYEYRCVATNTWKRAALSTW